MPYSPDKAKALASLEIQSIMYEDQDQEQINNHDSHFVFLHKLVGYLLFKHQDQHDLGNVFMSHQENEAIFVVLKGSIT